MIVRLAPVLAIVRRRTVVIVTPQHHIYRRSFSRKLRTVFGAIHGRR